MSARNKATRRSFLRGLGVMTGSAAFLRAPSVWSQPKTATVKLATINSLSGGLARYGQEIERGIAIAIDTINAKGLRIGDASYTIEHQAYDDKTDASTSAKLVERVVTGGEAQMVMAGVGSTIVKSSIPVAQRLRFPMMALWGAVDGVFAGQKQNPYLYGALAPFSVYYTAIFQMAATFEAPKIRKVAMITPNDELGVFLAKQYLPANLKGTGIEIAGIEFFPPKSQQYSTALERIRRLGAEAFLINCYTPDILGILKEMQAVNYFPPMIIVQNTGGLAEGIGDSANGLIGPSYWDASLQATKDSYIGTSRDFVALYKAKFKQDPPDYVAALGAHNVVVYSEVLRKAGTVDDHQAINAAFRSLDGETFFSPVKFDIDGLNRKARCYAAQIQGGVPRLVFPREVRTAKPIHPYPGWKKA